MIDLSFLTEGEKEAILKVLNRDSELKKSEEQRIRHLQDEVNDENELKYKSGQWFYEAKSRRHRDKIHGADLVRASIRKRKNPATIAELSQSSKDKSQRRWVNSVNQDLFIPPELYGVMEPPDEAEEDLMPTNVESIQSARKANLNSPDIDKNIMKNGTASPAKQRKNPFNSEGAVDETDLQNEMSKRTPEPGLVNGQAGKTSDIMSSIIKYGVKLPYPSPIGGRKTSQETEENISPKLPPVPKPRKLLVNGKPPERSNSSLQREDSLNKRKGILKRRSSSSSTDSESIRIPPNVEALKLVLPASPILEAEQTHLFDDQMTSSENSPDRQKQVRFSEYVLQKPPTPNPESYNAREIGEFGILDPSSYQHDLDNELLDHHPYEEPRPAYFDVDNTTEDLDLEENPTVSQTLQAPSNSSPILDVEKKPEDQSQELNYSRLYEIPDQTYPEINIDSAGTEPLYAVVKKPSKSTSPDQEKDFEMEPRFLGQRGKIENAYQIEKTLEFGKSFGGDGKINFGARYTSIQPGKVYGSTNEDFLAPERSKQVQSSYEEPKPSDYVPKWRRPLSLDNEDSLAQPTVQEFLDFGDEDTYVKPYSENRTDYKYSPVESNKDTQYRSIFLRNTPDVEIIQSSNFPVSQNLPSYSRPVREGFQTHEHFLDDNRERDLPKSANFKVMSMKDRIHDTSREQMSNPSQFQNLKHFWNVEDKIQSKGDVDTTPNRILTDVLKRNKPTRADLKQRNSKEIPTDDLSLPNSFDSSLSEEEQTSHKVASWLAHTPTVYGAEQVDANEDLVHPQEEVMENINKTLVDRNYQTKDFSSALQKLTEEALEAPKISETEHLRSEDILNSPFKKPYLLDERKKMTTILVNPTEKTRPTSGFYDRVVQVSSKQFPEQETKIAADIPAVTLKQYPKEIEESVERSVAPAKTENELKIAFQKLRDEYESNESDDEPQVEESNLPNEEQQLVETTEVIERSSFPKGNDHQEFISALNRLEIEASTPPVLEDEDEQPESVSTLNTASPIKSSFKIGFEHLMPTEHDTLETPQKNNVAYTVQSYPPYFEDRNQFEEVVEKTTTPSRKDEDDLRASLKKLEQEAALIDPSGELEDSYENTQPLQSTGNITTVDSFTIPSFDAQNMPSPSHSVENKSNLDDLYANRTKKSTKNIVDTYMIKAKEKPKYTFQEKLPVEEEPLQKTIVTTEESSADYRNRIMRLEEEAAASVPEEPEDQSEGETFQFSPAPMKDVFISKKVFSSNESMPTELPQPQPYAYDEMANSPQSPSDQIGSFTGSAENVLYKKPDTPSEKSNSKKGMDESHPILNALKRSAAKTLNSKAVQEVSPTSTNEGKLENQKEDMLAPLENSFPENAEKFKRMSQSVPTFLQDDTDGRETDSASESSFQIGRHKKSPSSLTNLSGSSGMASMSSVSGSVMSVYSGDFGNVDIKGNIEYSIEYVEQLKEFLIYIYQCKDLAAADVKKQRSDPYVKAYLLPEKAKMGKRKTAVKKKTLNPVYNEILRYKIPKQSLQAQTLNLSVWHRDVLGRNSFLGEVNQNLANWEWENKQKNWYPLEPRTPASSIGLVNRGEMKLSLQYVPVSPSEVGKKPNTTGEVHIWIRECIQLPMLRENKINSFVKCTILPDTSRKSRQKTRTVDKTPNPIFNHTMVYDGFKEDDLREACVELTVWDHNKLTNHFLGGIRIGQGTGKSYGTPVDWMDSSPEESTVWQKMIASPNTWIDGMLPLRMFKMAKLAK
ncbi:synaptotagmin-like protein 2 isoform X13 [Phyllobates terribilis]|uniref:synaptotagmin-like protein 2 isoform X13 n=1 Tax=Phyllobates terribilis TaxID=111132 RepID=UPI003CCACF6B